MDDYGVLQQYPRRSKTDLRVPRRPQAPEDYINNAEFQQKPVKRVIREPKIATVTPESGVQRKTKRSDAKTPISNYSGEIEISDLISEDDPRNTKTPQKPDFKEYEAAVGGNNSKSNSDQRRGGDL